jgi:flagellar biosynthetic protein FliS
MSSLHQSKALAAYKALHLFNEGGNEKLHILEMLLDGLAASLAEAKSGVRFEDTLKRDQGLARACRIVAGLGKALDRKVSPELVDNLAAIYLYFLKNLKAPVVQQKPAVLDELLTITNTLREAFTSGAQPRFPNTLAA